MKGNDKMKKRVSLKEVVATKIIFAVLIAGYYWMWSRTDWQPEYAHLQSVWGGLLLGLLFMHALRVSKYKKEGIDELAEKNLQRCDGICLKFFLVFMIIIAYLGGILGHVQAISTMFMGWLILGAVIAVSVLRTVLFVIMDTKGV